MSSGYQLNARIPEELAGDMRDVVKAINKEAPEARATISTVTRYAISKYVQEYKATKGLIVR